MLCWTWQVHAQVNLNYFTLYHFSLALQREQYLREKKMGSDAYRKALDAQVTTSVEASYLVIVEVTTKLNTENWMTLTI